MDACDRRKGLGMVGGYQTGTEPDCDRSRLCSWWLLMMKRKKRDGLFEQRVVTRGVREAAAGRGQEPVTPVETISSQGASSCSYSVRLSLIGPVTRQAGRQGRLASRRGPVICWTLLEEVGEGPGGGPRFQTVVIH